MLIGVKMSRVKNETSWLTKLSCVSIFAAPCEHCDAVWTVLGGTSPKIHPAAKDFWMTSFEGVNPVSTVAWKHAGVATRRQATESFRMQRIRHILLAGGGEGMGSGPAYHRREHKCGRDHG